MGPLGSGSFYAEKVQKALHNAQVEVAVVNILKGSKVTEQIISILSEVESISSFIALGWGSHASGFESMLQAMIQTPLSSQDFGEAIVPWVNKGGRFIVQGVNPNNFSDWPKKFGKSWKGSGFSRSDYVCNGKSDDDTHWCKWYHKAAGAITTASYNAKAALISEDNLFQDIETSESAIALAKYGEGSISFFGDVNSEDETCDIMAIIARGN